MARISGPIRRRARRLRGEATEAERRLWACLRDRRLEGWRFRRQHPIPPYVVDFACVRARLVVEADGGQHAESASDRGRDRCLRQRGWRVLRFWNHDILANTEGVIASVAAALPPPGPPPLPSPAGAEEGVDGAPAGSGSGRDGGGAPAAPAAGSGDGAGAEGGGVAI